MVKRRPTRKRRPETVLSDDVRRILETGTDLFGPRLSEDESREKFRGAWRRHGARVTRDFVRRHPGQRPWGWWVFEAPAPRLIAPEPDGVRWRNWEERSLFQRLLDTTFLYKHGLMGAEEHEILEKETIAWRRLMQEQAALENLPDEVN